MGIGDTQWMPSQIVKDYVSNQSKQNTGGTGHHTYDEGDTGYVDLANGFGDSEFNPRPSSQHVNWDHQQQATSERDGSPDDLSQDAGPQEKFTPTVPNAREDVTPVAGKKHKRDGTPVGSTVDRTSNDLNALFGSATKSHKHFGMTQLFENTQAGSSSPFTAQDPKSDPIFSRPSPDIRSIQPSTPAHTSSPLLGRKQAFNLACEPRDTYIPVDESQRRRNLENNSDDSASANSEPDEWGDNSQRLKQEHKRKRQQIEKRARDVFSTFTAPKYRQHKGANESRAAWSAIEIVTPCMDKKEVVTISSESKENEPVQSDNEDNVDIYDELNRIVPSAHHRTTNTKSLANKPEPTHNTLPTYMRRPTSSPAPGRYGSSTLMWERRILTAGNADRSYESSIKGESAIRPKLKARQQIDDRIENSQPEDSLIPLGPPPRPILPSSVTSQGFVSQSQLALGSARCQDDLENAMEDGNIETSSIPAAPSRPRSSSRQNGRTEDAQTPASSPPGILPITHILNGNAEGADHQNQDKEYRSSSATSGVKTSGQSKEINAFLNRTKQFQRACGEPSIPETSPITASKSVPEDTLGNPARAENGEVNFHANGDFSQPRNTFNTSSDPKSVFQTAQSRHLTPTSSSNVQASSQVNRSATPSSASRRWGQKMIQIAAQPSPSAPSKVPSIEELSVFRKEDQEYQDIIDGSVIEHGTPNKLRSSDNRKQNRSKPSIMGCSSPQEPLKEQISVTNEKLPPVSTRTSQCLPQPATGRDVPNTAIATNDSHAYQAKNIEVLSFPNRVFAIFRDLTSTYCPATVIQRSPSSATCFMVRFDEGYVDSIENRLIKRLELRVGDLVKINKPGKKNTVFAVHSLTSKGMQNRTQKTATEPCDVYGNPMVILEPRQRTSLPSSTKDNANKQLKVAISDLYITTNLWPRLEDRAFAFLEETIADPGVQTPLDSQISGTPSSRRRNKSFPAMPMKDTKIEDEVSQGTNLIFCNMAFCVSISGEKETEKTKVSSLIREYGGEVLPEGFDQLCEDPSSNQVPLHEKRAPTRANYSALCLTTKAKSLGFVALLSDCHSRRAKYMQALALNVPCLHPRWILDSVEKGHPQPWATYLLPAGDSAPLDGATKSRTMFGAPFADAKFPTDSDFRMMFSHRPQFFDHKRIILVIGGGKIGGGKIGERRAVYDFLIRAANVMELKQAKDIPTMRAAIQEDNRWDLVVVEDSKVADTRNKLFGLKGATRSTRVGKMPRGNTDVRAKVVGDESILQSLIFGSWIE